MNTLQLELEVVPEVVELAVFKEELLNGLYAWQGAYHGDWGSC